MPPWMLSKLTLVIFAVSPSLAAMALPRSTSKPTILPESSMFSFGGYVASVAIVSVPLDLNFSGTSAAAAASTPVEEAVVPPVVPPEVAFGVDLLLEQPASRASARAADPAMAAVERVPDCIFSSCGVIEHIQLPRAWGTVLESFHLADVVEHARRVKIASRANPECVSRVGMRGTGDNPTAAEPASF